MTSNREIARTAGEEQAVTGTTRRDFLRNVTLIPLMAACIAPAALARTQRIVPRLPALPGARPGALFNPDYRPEDWPVIAPALSNDLPLLGAYDSQMAGTLETQVIWAQAMGLGYFLAAYNPYRTTQATNIAMLCDIAARHGQFKIGLCVDLAQDQPGPMARRRRTPAQTLGALRTDINRFFAHGAYLRSPRSGPVVAMIDGGDVSLRAAVTQEVEKRGGVVLAIPASRRWQPATPGDKALSTQARVHDVYLGVSTARTRGGAPLALRCQSAGQESLAAVIVAPTVRAGQRSTWHFPTIDQTGAATTYVIVDSFNNWGTASVLEPGTRGGAHHIPTVRAWTASLRA